MLHAFNMLDVFFMQKVPKIQQKIGFPQKRTNPFKIQQNAKHARRVFTQKVPKIQQKNGTFLLGHPFNIRLSRDDIQTMLLAFNMLDVFFTQKVPKIQQKNRFSAETAHFCWGTRSTSVYREMTFKRCYSLLTR